MVNPPCFLPIFIAAKSTRKMDKFTHLHVHSHYSILDGMSKVPDLINKCLKNGMHAMALTDHGNMFGIKDLVDTAGKINGKCKKAVKEIWKKAAFLWTSFGQHLLQ